MVANVKPFRFGVQSRSAGPRGPWLETLRAIEALGYDSLSWPDHFVRGFEPVAAMAAAAIATERLRLSGFVFDNDFRHPVVLAMSAGSIDILSNGRVELGTGRGNTTLALRAFEVGPLVQPGVTTGALDDFITRRVAELGVGRRGGLPEPDRRLHLHRPD